MARPLVRLIRFGTFDLLNPEDVGQAIFVDRATNTIEVVVQNTGANIAFTASISGGGSGSLNQDGSSPIFRASLGAGQDVPEVMPPEGANNKSVDVQAFTQAGPGEAAGIPFRAAYGGSGSGSSGSHLFLSVVAHRCHFCRGDQPVPVALRLQLDTPVSAGTCADCDQLNQPSTLVHSLDPSFACCWLSEPIDFCCDSANPGFWMLQKVDPTTWILLLRRGDDYVATYRYITLAENDCSFPITLELAGLGGSECEDWPQTITISPAP